MAPLLTVLCWANPVAAAKIACVGDSITYGYGLNAPSTESYPAALQSLVGTTHTVENFGVNGCTLLKNGDKPYWNEASFTASDTFEPDVVVIMLGTNDSKPQNWVHSAEFSPDYHALIDHYRALGALVYVAAPPPVYEPGAFDISPDVVATEMVPLVKEIAKEANAPLIDVFQALSGHASSFSDTVHPNAEGAQLIAETVAAVLQENGFGSAAGAGGTGGVEGGGGTGSDGNPGGTIGAGGAATGGADVLPLGGPTSIGGTSSGGNGNGGLSGGNTGAGAATALGGTTSVMSADATGTGGSSTSAGGNFTSAGGNFMGVGATSTGAGSHSMGGGGLAAIMHTGAVANSNGGTFGHSGERSGVTGKSEVARSGDSGSPRTARDNGCGCRVDGKGGLPSSMFVAGLLLVPIARRRRTRMRESPRS